MARTHSLILLINSLSKGEKRYFKLYTALQKGSKDYLFLFTFIEKGGTEEEIKKKFRRERKGASYEAACKYLFKVVTDCLLQLRSGQGKSTQLIIALLKGNILFEKSMYAEGFKQLQKVQAIAEKNEHYIIQLWAARLELYYLCNLNFYHISEEDLIKKQMKISELLKYAGNIHRHTSLYELLRHRLLYKGNVRTRQHKEELNDLVVTELNLISNSLAETFESFKTHLLFQSHYFITISDYNSALRVFYELNELLEKHRFLWADSPLDYLSAMEGILDSLHTIRHYRKMSFFLDKLDRFRHDSVYLQVMIQRAIFIYKLAGLLDSGNFKEAIELKERFETSLFKKIHLLDLSKQAEVYLYTALIYIGTGNIARAHYYLNRILLESKLYYNLPVYRTFRLIHLLVHYELGNHDYIEYETRSIKRSLHTGQPASYLLEKIIFRFVKQASRVKSNTEKNSLWLQFQKDFKTIRDNKYEIQILKIFDFSVWIEAKLCKKSFAGLLKEKYSTQQQAF